MDNKKQKLSLTGSLASLTKEVQQKGSDNKNEIAVESMIGENMAYNFNRVTELAKQYKASPVKLATVYIASTVKKDLERLKNIEEMDGIPLTALTSAIIDNFLTENEAYIRGIINAVKSRF